MNKFRHVLSAQQLNREDLEEVFEAAEKMRKIEEDREERLLKEILKDQTILLIFGEPSTRTRVSFDLAIKKLGGYPLAIENLEKTSSLAKGESLEDTLKTYAALGIRGVVIRHSQEGLPQLLAKISDQSDLGISIINAGDSSHEHPTQAYLDLYTVWREKKEKLRKGELTVAYVGDLKDSRVAHSGVIAFSRFNVKFVFITWQELRLDYQWTKDLHNWDFTPNILKFAKEIDVWNFIRFQKERKGERVNIEKLQKRYYRDFTPTEKVQKRAKPDALFLHSRPRGPELPVEVDQDLRQRYIINFDFPDPWQNQETNGLYLRMALLSSLH